MSITKRTIEFLMENRFRNSRLWYQEHKEDYQRLVLAPMQELVRGLEPYVLRMDPLLITEPKVDKTISRIYRDTRFSKDKTLYREVMWVSFGRDRHQFPNFPGFYFEFSPSQFLYGCGYYEADTAAMGVMRELILAQDPTFLKAERAMEKQEVFTLEGDCYKRSKFAQQPEQLRNWLDRKNIFFTRVSTDFDLLFSDALAQQVGGELLLLEPVFNFLCLVATTRQEQERSLYTGSPSWEC